MSAIRTARSGEHPRRNFEPAIRPRIAQCAAENRTIRFVDHLMDCNPHPEPWMPGINKHSENGPVGVLELRSTIHAAGPPRSDISRQSPIIDYERRHHAAAVDPNAHKPAAVLAAVKDKPFGRPQEGPPSLTAAVRGSRTIRAGRDERMAPPGAEQKNVSKQKRNMLSDQLA